MSPARAGIADYDVTAIDREITQQCKDGRFSGTVIVRAGGQEIYSRSCGFADLVNDRPNDRETRFKIYSVSKFMTALTIMRLVERRVMTLDASVSDYIAGLPSEWSAVTVRHLLNHSSGIGDLTEKLGTHFTRDHASAMEAVLSNLSDTDRSLTSPPGSQFRYNNFGFELLAAAASAAQKPFADLVETEVFLPAGMTSASVERPSIIMGHPAPVTEPGLALGYNGVAGALQQAINFAFIQLGAGAVRAAADDFVALDSALAEGRLISSASYREMTFIPDDRADDGRRYGLGVFVEDTGSTKRHGHTGGTNGYISAFERFPGDDAMLIVLSNRAAFKTRWLRDAVASLLLEARATKASPR